jgi:signal transduction histidine kinase/DNA-binding response OmpR family regulator
MLPNEPGDAAQRVNFLRGGGGMGEATRVLDWSATPVGAAEQWPRSLKTIVRMMLDSRYAMWLAWGPELTFFCNDAYRPTLGAKRNFLGAPACQVWAEIWPEIGPRVAQVLNEGEATWDEGLLLFLERQGFVEETYHSFSYSPVHGDQGMVEGMLCVVTEETARVLSARRLASLGALAGASLATSGVDAAASHAARALDENRNDLPFGMLYLLEPDAASVRLAAGFGPGPGAAQAMLSLADPAVPWPLADAMASASAVLVDAPGPRPAGWPPSPWNEPIERAMVLPLAPPGRSKQVFGFLVVGISPRLPFDAEYRRYLLLAAAQVANSVAGAQAFADARRQAEALAELDRAKTAFFSNVSHELRTPLTLILGPLRELLMQTDSLPDAALRELGLVERNAQRLLKLVNMLLDFSRIEAGRLEARYVHTDLAQLTRELAGIFRSAIEHAGLRFEVECDAALSAVDVDPDMWEKVVLNLLSNAFKFTFTGSIRVCLQAANGSAVLRVSDSGAGIPADQLDKVFDRFQRVQGARSRTQEGAGIGLSLVKELVGLHGGRVDVASVLGQGTSFTVTVPLRHANALVASERSASPADTEGLARHGAYVDDVLRAEPPGGPEGPRTQSRSAARVLVADDNADMRDYLARLLAPHWNVTTVSSGEEALRLMQHSRPHLVLTDVMMPGLDGFSLLQAMRGDPRLSDLPVIMLSARAGEEARIEGLQRSADDYLVKPFSSRELIARIDAHLSRAEARALRVQLDQRLSSVFENAPVGLALLKGAEHTFEYSNRESTRMLDERGVLGMPVRGALPELAGQGFHELLDQAFAHAVPVIGRSLRMQLKSPAGAAPAERYVDFVCQPMTDHDGRVDGIAVVSFDVTELHQARRDAETANRTKDEFLAVLGHELRNPLSPIVTALHLMRVRGAHGVENERQIIERQVGHMIRLVDDLLDVSRIFGGKLSLRKAPVALAQAVSQALEATSSLFEHKRHKLSVNVPATGLDVLADSVRLTQTISNLLTNAARYTPAEGCVRINAQRIGASVVLAVEDEGVGLRAEDLSRIFEMFVQAPQRNDRAEGGLGLGLSIARSLARQHGGELTAASDGLGQGTRFTLTLPALAEAEARANVAAAAVRPSPTGGQALLVVDDNRDAADSLVEALRLIGYPTQVAYDPADALELVREHPPELAIVDIGLPAMDGIELTLRMKRMPRLEQLKVIALSGYGLAAERARSRAAGIEAHVVKPVDLGQLTGLIAQLLAARSSDPHP